MAHYQTRKRSTQGKQETIRRRCARSIKRGTLTQTRAGHERVGR